MAVSHDYCRKRRPHRHIESARGSICVSSLTTVSVTMVPLSTAFSLVPQISYPISKWTSLTARSAQSRMWVPPRPTQAPPRVTKSTCANTAYSRTHGLTMPWASKLPCSCNIWRSKPQLQQAGTKGSSQSLDAHGGVNLNSNSSQLENHAKIVRWRSPRGPRGMRCGEAPHA